MSRTSRRSSKPEFSPYAAAPVTKRPTGRSRGKPPRSVLGKRVLATGAAGGVGRIAVQLGFVRPARKLPMIGGGRA